MSRVLIRGFISNGLANTVQKVVRIADQLLLVPFFLTQWGADYYGEWLTLSIIPSVLAFSDLGFGSAVSNGFVLAYASGDRQKAADLRKSGFWTISLSVLLGVLLTAVLLTFAGEMSLFDKSLIDANDARCALVFMMASTLASFYTQLVEGFFRGVRKAALGGFLISGHNLLNIIVGLVVLNMGCGVVGYAFSKFIVAILFTIVFSIIGSRLVELDGVSGVIRRSDVKEIAKKGMGYLMTPIWQSIYFQGTTFVVRLTLGAESVAVFNTVRTVCRSVNQFFSIFNASIFSDLQYEYAKGNIATVQKCFRIAVRTSFVVGVLGMICLMAFGLYVYEWWTNGVLSVPTVVWNTFMVGVLMNAVWWTSVVTYRMTNKPYHFAIASTITATVSVGICYLLSNYYDLVGAAVGCLLFEFVMAIYVLPDSCRNIQMSWVDLFRHVKTDFQSVSRLMVRKK